MRSVTALFLLAALLASSVSAAELGTYLHGDWFAVGTVAGEKVKGELTVKPAADGKCQIITWKFRGPDGVTEGTALVGIDPASGKLVEYAFQSEGNHWVNTYDDVLGDGVGKTTGVRTGTNDGKAFKAKLVVERTSKSRFVYRVESETRPVNLVFARE